MKSSDLYKVSLDDNKNNETIIRELLLVEDFVDEEYKLSKLTPKCEKFFENIRNRFLFTPTEVPLINRVDGIEIGKLPVIPISFQELAAYGEELGYTEYAVSQWMRMLWKNGKVRRFYQGYWQGAFVYENITGTKWGVMYLWAKQ